jgi:tetratricopeptide (TPR) repeat protein
MIHRVRNLPALAFAFLMLHADVTRADLIMPSNRPPTVDNSGTVQKDPSQDVLDQARAKFKQGQYEEALTLLKAARAKNVALPPAGLLLAELFLGNNLLSQGRSALEQAAIEEPDYPGIYLVFGTLALAENRFTDARLHFEKAATLASSEKWTPNQQRSFRLPCHMGMATLAENRQDWSAAQAALAGWLELDPRNGEARQRLARALLRNGDSQGAVKELETAVKDEPSLPPAAITMARLYTEQGDHKRAGQWMQYALKRDPRNPRVHLGMAAWLFEQGKAEEARRYADTAGGLAPDSRELKWLRGLIARRLKDYRQAETYFQALHDETPGDREASNQLALVLVEQPDKSKQSRALQLAEINARLQPDSPAALSTLGWVYYRLGRLDEAERVLQAAAPGNNLSAETAYYLAHLLANRGRIEPAKQLLKAALDAGKDFILRQDAQELFNQLAKNP